MLLGRGFTGHEHLPLFGLINMNARLYDPALGRFLSPDPHVQMPDFTQNFNRYSYALNNPLRYTDPDGELVGTVVTGIIGLVKAVVKGIIIPWFVGFSDSSKAGKMFEQAWTDYGNEVTRAWRIDKGLIKTDPNKSNGKRVWELISRFTWQLPQTIFGNAYSHTRNVWGAVDRVDYLGGATFVTNENSKKH